MFFEKGQSQQGYNFSFLYILTKREFHQIFTEINFYNSIAVTANNLVSFISPQTAFMASSKTSFRSLLSDFSYV